MKEQVIWENDIDSFDICIINNDFIKDLLNKLRSEWFNNAQMPLVVR
ncbi:Uncharacterised protein [Actinobacillus equuli]|nr:Uncharacterised protein [Actinobacillus equuli]